MTIPTISFQGETHALGRRTTHGSILTTNDARKPGLSSCLSREKNDPFLIGYLIDRTVGSAPTAHLLARPSTLQCRRAAAAHRAVSSLSTAAPSRKDPKRKDSEKKISPPHNSFITLDSFRDLQNIPKRALPGGRGCVLGLKVNQMCYSNSNDEVLSSRPDEHRNYVPRNNLTGSTG